MIWQLLARLVARPGVREYLVALAQRRPYTHIMSADGSDTYMFRWWLFNPYSATNSNELRKHWAWLPSVRVHWIRRPDRDRHLHNHPWPARTFVMRGWYSEEREGEDLPYLREEGYTGTLAPDDYHRILQVSAGGVWTLFWTWRYAGSWGFKVDGAHVPWRDYKG